MMRQCVLGLVPQQVRALLIRPVPSGPTDRLQALAGAAVGAPGEQERAWRDEGEQVVRLLVLLMLRSLARKRDVARVGALVRLRDVGGIEPWLVDGRDLDPLVERRQAQRETTAQTVPEGRQS